MPRTREQHSRDSRLGALVRLAQTANRTEMTAPARAAGPAALEWHEKRVDPEGKLSPKQRLQMAEAARRLYYLRLAEASRKARAARKTAQDQA